MGATLLDFLAFASCLSAIFCSWSVEKRVLLLRLQVDAFRVARQAGMSDDGFSDDAFSSGSGETRAR